MDLISRDKAQEIIPKVVLGMSDFAECIRDSVDSVFDNCPSAFEGMTNGEVLESVFPNVVIDRISDTCSVAAIRIGTEEIVSCYKKWLDSPYKGGNE